MGLISRVSSRTYRFEMTDLEKSVVLDSNNMERTTKEQKSSRLLNPERATKIFIVLILLVCFGTVIWFLFRINIQINNNQMVCGDVEYECNCNQGLNMTELLDKISTKPEFVAAFILIALIFVMLLFIIIYYLIYKFCECSRTN